ncbi:MAG: hypothetical protein JETT_1909 [Candidatus Jettenia ecosi]|uniref:Uncharacterized protein n=1 Tax=Candidatus Jettenia ecosi TaxID=2494326 RepID=A0A533QBM5_9BACT|nr:MAG: hypothetical protein JETT_1909 [Candidatus Jettenia ecosi]
MCGIFRIDQGNFHPYLLHSINLNEAAFGRKDVKSYGLS